MIIFLWLLIYVLVRKLRTCSWSEFVYSVIDLYCGSCQQNESQRALVAFYSGVSLFKLTSLVSVVFVHLEKI